MLSSEDMEIEKLKVADLRAALGGRGLDTKGTKPILVQRLKVNKPLIITITRTISMSHNTNENLGSQS